MLDPSGRFARGAVLGKGAVQDLLNLTKYLLSTVQD
jgi:hypothetical protein